MNGKWAAASVGSVLARCATRDGWNAAVVVAAPWLAQMAVARAAGTAPWFVFLAPGLTLAGWFVFSHLHETALDRVRAAHARRSLVLGTLGMLAGLAWDARGAGPQLAASLCGAGATGGVGTALWLHWSSLPAMHAGMLAGGAGTTGTMGASGARCAAGRAPYRDLICRVGCCASMLLGMSAGALVMTRAATALSAGTDVHVAAMLGGMFAGMVWGMAAFALAGRAGGWLWRASAPEMRFRHGQHGPVRP